MAKTEQESTVEAPKKPKAKKRQHGVDHDEEIAQKTFVVETPNEDGEGIKEEQQVAGLTKAEAEAEKASADAAEAMAVVSLKKSKKRKSNGAKNVKEKRRRTSQSDEDDDDADDDDKDGSDDDGDADDEPMEYDLPTANELNAAEQIENATAQETIRQKKKKKHDQRLQELKTHSHDKEKQRNEEYLQKWKYKQEEWKFEKLRQISIQQNVFDEQKISTTLWPIALEYLSGSKGASRQKIIELANEVIAASDKECNEKTDDEGRQEIVNSARYQRARDLLQSLD